MTDKALQKKYDRMKARLHKALAAHPLCDEFDDPLANWELLQRCVNYICKYLLPEFEWYLKEIYSRNTGILHDQGYVMFERARVSLTTMVFEKDRNNRNKTLDDTDDDTDDNTDDDTNKMLTNNIKIRR